MGQGEEDDVDDAGGGRVERAEGTVGLGQMRMHCTQGGAGLRVGPEISDLQVRVAVDQPDEFSTGVTGSTENRNTRRHRFLQIEERGLYAYVHNCQDGSAFPTVSPFAL